MKACRYDIEAREFDRAGAATADLKRRLKRLGVEPAAVRRAVIAAYEAAMNIVIHAERGEMRAELAPGRLRMVFEDRGPGISDIEKAMTPGFSTAPEFARSMGFGAGLGLANMKRHADRLDVGSEAGSGTRVVMDVLFTESALRDADRHSIRLDPARCRGCLACVRECPTQALRLWEDAPELLDYLCLDCGRCVAVCPARALVVDMAETPPGEAAPAALVAPPALFVQFGGSVGFARVEEALANLGCSPVNVLEEWENAVARAAREYAESGAQRPVISPVCPAVLNLIELKFPAVIPHVAPCLSPMECAAADMGEGALLAVSCPAQHTALARRSEESGRRTLALSGLRKALAPLVAGGADASREESGEREAPRALEVSGMAHVMAALDEIENGLLADASVVELYACEGGCFGAPLAAEEAAVARYRWRRGGRAGEASRRAAPRPEPLEPRSGIRLHPDMARAIAMLGEIDALAAELPGRDCALCGAPTCAAFAEDVVAGRAPKAECRFIRESEQP